MSSGLGWMKQKQATEWVDKKQKNKLKTVTAFPKWNIDMVIQLQILTMHMFTSLLYICYSAISEKHPFTSYPAAKLTPKTQVVGFMHPRKTSGFFVVAKRAFT